MGLLGTAVGSYLGQAQLPIVSIDMIPGNGVGVIDPILNAAPGAAVTVDVLLRPGGAGVSSYGVSLQFDNGELTHVGNNELLPAGFNLNLTVGSGGWTPNVAAGIDQVSTFEAVSFGVAGPVNGPWLTIGTISFTVGAPVNDGLADVTAGFFALGFDGMNDNGFLPLVPVFNPGFVIPEPGVISGAAFLLGFAGFHGCRRRR